jgi:hypothetical protein
VIEPYLSKYQPGCACSTESTGGVELVRIQDSIGRIAPFLRCLACGRANASKPVPSRLLSPTKIATAPLIKSSYVAEDLHVCEVCGGKPAQDHHWAPRKMFGPGEADEWPHAFLCQKHHSAWHRIVTPTISEGDAPRCACGEVAWRRLDVDGRDAPVCSACIRGKSA